MSARLAPAAEAAYLLGVVYAALRSNSESIRAEVVSIEPAVIDVWSRGLAGRITIGEQPEVAS